MYKNMFVNRNCYINNLLIGNRFLFNANNYFENEKVKKLYKTTCHVNYTF